MNVFITGATGFLGTELVKRLVNEGHNVYLLIRNRKKANSLLEKINFEQQKHVNFYEGELTSEKLGLSSNDLIDLKNNIDIIFHTAAYLSFDDSLRDDIFNVNVEGTRQVLNFAQTIDCKKFIHVSTAYTLGNRTLGKEELYPLDSEFINAYEESKCHAEHLVMSYGNYFDVTIMRPAIIVGDSKTGQANTTFGLYGVLKTIQLLKRRAKKEGYETDVRLLMNKATVSNLVPVDYVIDSLVLGMYYSKTKTIYHITNSQPPTNELVVDVAKDVLEYQSISLASESEIPSFTPLEATINKSLHMFKDYLNRTIQFDDENMRELLRYHSVSTLDMDEGMLYRIISGFENKNLVLK
ncbi:short-chain dehydrogenase [Anaerobacillus arseniciselenatis]|uniref:Short-chain dehydrogenase n=1 Tax=Anaerobacillus arseniciselenatis TaxID=85682 RepID=A0A1S2LKM3_9BACI|nr:SDR family oxidoreductase [Anaerobacillus arseniciselenatis]OIJ12936.1 short-chain dehydrogenase [Anaerobacillus arseniciselenatis]